MGTSAKFRLCLTLVILLVAFYYFAYILPDECLNIKCDKNDLAQSVPRRDQPFQSINKLVGQQFINDLDAFNNIPDNVTTTREDVRHTDKVFDRTASIPSDIDREYALNGVPAAVYNKSVSTYSDMTVKDIQEDSYQKDVLHLKDFIHLEGDQKTVGTNSVPLSHHNPEIEKVGLKEQERRHRNCEIYTEKKKKRDAAGPKEPQQKVFFSFLCCTIFTPIK